MDPAAPVSTSVRNDRGDDNPGDAFKSWRAEVGLSPATSRSASSRVSIEGGMAAKTREKISVRARSRCSWTIRRSVDRAGQRMSYIPLFTKGREIAGWLHPTGGGSVKGAFETYGLRTGPLAALPDPQYQLV